MARPTKHTDELERRLLELLRRGNFASTAAKAVGISESTYYDWLRRGKEEPEGIYHDFFLAVEQAEAMVEIDTVELLHMHFDKPALLKFYITHRFPNWRQRTPVQPEAAAAIEPTTPAYDLSRLTIEEAEALKELLAKATPDTI